MMDASNSQSLPVLRTVRSYVKRLGRMTKSQKQALETLRERYIVSYNSELNLSSDALFSNNNPLYLEIGIGMGEHFVYQVQKRPDTNWVGIDVHDPGIGQCCRDLDRLGLSNGRLMAHDAVEILTHRVPEGSLAGVYILFPDPWPKKRHHKRRLIQASLLSLLHRALKPNGVVQIMTDWAEYAEHIQSVFSADPRFIDISAKIQLSVDRVITKFERKGVAAGRAISRLAFASQESTVEDSARNTS